MTALAFAIFAYFAIAEALIIFFIACYYIGKHVISRLVDWHIL